MSKNKRSHVMSCIRSKGTKIECMVEGCLFRMGFYFEKHSSEIKGRPDFVLRDHGVVIFVNGCFWHRHGCEKTSVPKSNTEFWNDKFRRNIERDAGNRHFLEDRGWKVAVLWECGILRDCESSVRREIFGIIGEEDK